MRPASAGFTLAEVLLATAIAMIMLFGTLYGSGESFTLIHEGDARVQTHLQARRVLDRLLKDCRYSEDLVIDGVPGRSWALDLQPSGAPALPRRTWTWEASTGILLLEEERGSETALEGLREFDLRTGLVDGSSGPEIAMVAAEWMVEVRPGAGASLPGHPNLELGSATWIRRHAPGF